MPPRQLLFSIAAEVLKLARTDQKVLQELSTGNFKTTAVDAERMATCLGLLCTYCSQQLLAPPPRPAPHSLDSEAGHGARPVDARAAALLTLQGAFQPGESSTIEMTADKLDHAKGLVGLLYNCDVQDDDLARKNILRVMDEAGEKGRLPTISFLKMAPFADDSPLIPSGVIGLENGVIRAGAATPADQNNNTAAQIRVLFLRWLTSLFVTNAGRAPYPGSDSGHHSRGMVNVGGFGSYSEPGHGRPTPHFVTFRDIQYVARVACQDEHANLPVAAYRRALIQFQGDLRKYVNEDRHTLSLAIHKAGPVLQNVLRMAGSAVTAAVSTLDSSSGQVSGARVTIFADDPPLRPMPASPPRGAPAGGYELGSTTSNGYERKRGGNHLNPHYCTDSSCGKKTICGKNHSKKQK